MRILVTDANNRVALAVVRALGRAGHRLHLVGQEGVSNAPLAARSRYVRRFSFVPSLSREERFVRAIADLAATVDLVLPISTNVILTLSRRRGLFEAMGKPLPIPDEETLRLANAKDRLMALAQRMGIPTPRTSLAHDLEECGKLAAEAAFPLVLKLRDDEGLYLDPRERYRIVRTKEELIDAFHRLHALKEHPIVQEYIDGDGYGFSAVCADGEVIASFGHRRIREYPATGGPSSICVSVEEPPMTEAASALLRALRWRGAAMVEFKKERRTGRFVLMEINPRFAGSLPLGETVGVNLPDALVRGGVHPTPRRRRGCKMRFFFLDCAAVCSALSIGEKRRRYLGGFLRDLFDAEIRDGIFSLSDLRPGVDYLLGKIGRGTRSPGTDQSLNDVE